MLAPGALDIQVQSRSERAQGTKRQLFELVTGERRSGFSSGLVGSVNDAPRRRVLPRPWVNELIHYAIACRSKPGCPETLRNVVRHVRGEVAQWRILLVSGRIGSAPYGKQHCPRDPQAHRDMLEGQKKEPLLRLLGNRCGVHLFVICVQHR